MPVDYSKWDALELSDDSDIEVHPNVDKKSFIRAKQAQIHQERAQRKHQIETLKYERIINDGLLRRIDRLLDALKAHKASTEAKANVDELVFQSLIESAGDPADDKPPAPPVGVHANIEEAPTYSKMMASLVDQVKKEVESQGNEDNYGSYIKEIQLHHKKVSDLQKELLKKLAELEKEEGRKITSESYHTGFSSSHVAKPDPPKPTTERTPELMNPQGVARGPLNRADTGQSSGADADVEDESQVAAQAALDIENPEDIEPSAEAREFAKLGIENYRALFEFIMKHPDVLKERESDGLMVEAFNAQMEGKTSYAYSCVHGAYLFQTCRQLGRDGVQMFFKRTTDPKHPAKRNFLDEVNTVYQRIRTRTNELKQQSSETENVEQIQLHAVDPNTKINIQMPPKDIPDGCSPEEAAALKSAREVFESFPPGLQKAIEAGSLERINTVLGKMSVEEAEEVVEKLGTAGMLAIEEGIIDGTTEEGKKMVEQIEKTGLQGLSEGDSSGVIPVEESKTS